MDENFVAPYIPRGVIEIVTEDTYAPLPRTRADRPFSVRMEISNIDGDPELPDAYNLLDLLTFSQSYGETGVGANLDRSLATHHGSAAITENGSIITNYLQHFIPGPVPDQARGEHRFTLRTVADFQTPSLVAATETLQIWPVAGGSITGISEGQTITPAAAPALTIQLDDLYPDSTTWAQAYIGTPRDNATGTTIPNSQRTVKDSIPRDETLHLGGYGSVFGSDGTWTLEVLTTTPFGTDRITAVTFTVEGVGQSVEGWRYVHFGSVDNSGNGADGFDFDKDGIPNLLEFAFGLHPKLPDHHALPQPQLAGGRLSLSFVKPAGIIGVNYGAEWSSTLLPESWQSVPDTGSASTHTFSIPTDSLPGAFIRLVVEDP